jgi:phage terminase large subunit-like protein
LTISPPAVLFGSQTPTYLSVPPAVGSAGAEAVDLAASAGLVLDPWEALVLEHTLGERDRKGKKWSAFEIGVVVPRQNGKGSILEARELAGLFLFGERLILHSAHQFKTCVEHFRRVMSLIESTPDLERKVRRIYTASGAESIELVSGQRLRFVARSGGSARGFTGDLVVLDEAFELSADMMGALLPTLSARPNPQVWYTSSAPLAEAKSDVLRKVCKRGRAGTSPRLAYLEWCADRSQASDDREAWAAANPALGIRIEAEFIEAELGALEDEQFRRERLGIWYEDETPSVIDADTWRSLADPKSNALDPVAFAIDVTPERSYSAIAAAGWRSDGRLHGEIVDHRAGTGWLVDRVVELAAKHKPHRVTLDAGAAAGALLVPLAEAKVDVEPVTTRELVQACGAFHDDATNDRFRHIDQPDLNAALFGAATRPVGDAWAWNRKTSDVDISPLVAVTLARWAASQRPQKTAPLVAYR